jgi:hypothetical protein
MPLLSAVGIVFLAGFIGGLLNAFMSDNGFGLPTLADGIRRPGWLITAFIGGVAAVVSWGLYGPFTSYYVIGSAPVGAPSTDTFGLTLGALATAVLVGIGGARWLTDHVDKQLLRAAAVVAARKVANQPRANEIATATPARALELTNLMANPP